MFIGRRNFFAMTAGLAGASLLSGQAKATAGVAKYRAIAFDAFPIFDPRPVAALCEELFPGKGRELIAMWRTRQFEYTWLRTIAKRYADFERVTEDSLTFAAQALKIDMTREQRERLLQANFELKPWPDVYPALAKLREAGVHLGLLSNLTPNMLSGCIKAAGLDGMFDPVLSTDAAKTFKPDERAYQLGVDAFGLPREEILFVAFAGWDAVGAKSFGFPTFWVNRLGLPPEQFGPAPDATGESLADLLAFVAG
jgi:2-haloacid dehalogenase